RNGSAVRFATASGVMSCPDRPSNRNTNAVPADFERLRGTGQVDRDADRLQAGPAGNADVADADGRMLGHGDPVDHRE
ncbi:hypothetical protein ABZX92_43320, partial [Lentzea sp. NPDC006480]|uniref:hypothetical protein n=1 Tax=Lentzea sp. NPDC006480 TaxID=3157176 RepID=UPI0033B456E1